ncbi:MULTISPECIES: RGCVC family protein [unclassified Modestobacter]|uniref:RGCVC family protein n=1 Tax=unclassified Modestobacter TaxID=2643866 RepID=UPI0022AAA890|nr:MULTISPECIES: RGCVC family protein [unclassified Modestobacter]MCZ2815920.1 RGCVC family protein [Modestobacter sp. VKM Ac-2984]MCZ2826426.1 RGCVC family protein [Modestobacter sp. VKM Ac-2981]MCZ2852509.1 RGCVC family protein [Modestobacter sp. VKM Ac-2982]
MTAPTYAPSPTTALPAPADRTGDEPGCPACAHPMDAHDPIGARFCLATAAGTLDRGCACRIG